MKTEAGRHEDRGRQTDMKTGRQTDMKTCRQADMKTEAGRQA